MEAAGVALADAATLVGDSGLGVALSELVREVWSTNVARFAPEEHGDTSKSLGWQCYENLRVIASRRFLGDEAVPAEERWDIPGLWVGTPKNVLTMRLSGISLVFKKAPHVQGREPLWARFPEWETESYIRQDLARKNAVVLGGTAPRNSQQGELPFGPEDQVTPGRVRDFMVVWGGDLNTGETSGWLTVPVAWPELHFAGVTQLWADADGSSTADARRDEQEVNEAIAAQGDLEPIVRLKARPRDSQGEA
ncbi:hypothetical protein [Arthrobacter sp. NEB 688]|uniref:hypothetical protein n=1 Tax=Arthrobacter sp. NEB 688 TaxID=904039 RepID=UPI001566FAF2|nr:hypothetical protein [Arthrobacter sp. NEB 688]QKE82870.1 hypothetical protein HL663_02165 [Arthrobacter sp. NEB 688]